jgi:hypothetical protein
VTARVLALLFPAAVIVGSFAVIIESGTMHPDRAFTAAVIGIGGIVAFLAAWRRVFGRPR